uniref:Uncharacterized protein n=1 Tax=Lygus hesperus TaxID=30085 RepID=A0A0A9WQ38_LYGHE
MEGMIRRNAEVVAARRGRDDRDRISSGSSSYTTDRENSTKIKVDKLRDLEMKQKEIQMQKEQLLLDLERSSRRRSHRSSKHVGKPKEGKKVETDQEVETTTIDREVDDEANSKPKTKEEEKKPEVVESESDEEEQSTKKKPASKNKKGGEDEDQDDSTSEPKKDKKKKISESGDDDEVPVMKPAAKSTKPIKKKATSVYMSTKPLRPCRINLV